MRSRSAAGRRGEACLTLSSNVVAREFRNPTSALAKMPFIGGSFAGSAAAEPQRWGRYCRESKGLRKGRPWKVIIGAARHVAGTVPVTNALKFRKLMEVNRSNASPLRVDAQFSGPAPTGRIKESADIDQRVASAPAASRVAHQHSAVDELLNVPQRRVLRALSQGRPLRSRQLPLEAIK